MTADPLHTALQRSGALVLDGAMGTELQRRGLDVSQPLWSARTLIADPPCVLQIHREYLAAGADIITTNSFRTTARACVHAGWPDRSDALTRKAVILARQARAECTGRTILVAGSMAPLEDCYRPDLVPDEDALHSEHSLHARRLADAGVDFLLLETMGTIREAEAACRAAVDTGKEVVVSFLCTADGLLYGGESITEAVRKITRLTPTAFSLNCISPRRLAPALLTLQAATPLPLAVYANVGRAGEERAEIFVHDVSPGEYADFAEQWRQQGVRIIGGCCGTTPAYIALIRERFGDCAAS